MSGIGGDPDEYAPGNQPDGSYFNLFPDSSQPGLLGGQYADTQANAAANGAVGWANPSSITDISGDGTGLPLSVTVAPGLPQRGDGANAGSSGKPPFNLYDMLSRGLNTPFGSGALQVVQGLSQGME